MPNRPTRAQSSHRFAAAALGARLKRAREERKLSQQEVALRASLAIGTVRAVESQRSVDPSFFTILALADALEIEVGVLVAEVRSQGSPEVAERHA